MKLRWFAPFVFLAVPPACDAQRQYVELQREIALLGSEVRGLKSSMDENFQKLILLVQQSLDATNSANTSVAALENDLRERLREQEKSVSRPVAGISNRVDQMATELQALRQSVEALNSRFGKLETQLVDVASAIRTLQSPPSPPGAEGAPAGLSAEALFQNAERDKTRGYLDLALKGFTEYLQGYGNTGRAPEAQFFIGEIHYLKGDMDDAIKAFDLVLEKYQENPKTPDAHFMKGMALLKTGKRKEARDEFDTLIRRFPNHELSARAKDQLKVLGTSAAPKSRRK